jgi:hypothetical protein
LVHELAEEILIASGGPVAFISAWLEREASNKAFAVAAFHWRLGWLLQSLTQVSHYNATILGLVRL